MILWHLFSLLRERYKKPQSITDEMSFQEANLDLYSYNIGNEDKEYREWDGL